MGNSHSNVEYFMGSLYHSIRWLCFLFVIFRLAEAFSVGRRRQARKLLKGPGEIRRVVVAHGLGDVGHGSIGVD